MKRRKREGEGGRKEWIVTGLLDRYLRVVGKAQSSRNRGYGVVKYVCMCGGMVCGCGDGVVRSV